MSAQHWAAFIICTRLLQLLSAQWRYATSLTQEMLVGITTLPVGLVAPGRVRWRRTMKP